MYGIGYECYCGWEWFESDGRECDECGFVEVACYIAGLLEEGQEGIWEDFVY